MSSQLHACEAAKILRSLVKGGAGAAKGFDEYQALEALRLMAKGPVGRPTIERVVGIGEASAKTLIRTLREYGLAARCGAAHCATSLGVQVVRALEEVCLAGPIAAPLEGDLAEVVVALAPPLEPPSSIVDVYGIRDYLVARSCKPVLVGAYWPPDIARFPGVPPEMEKVLGEVVVKALADSRCVAEPEVGTAVAVVPARCSSKAVAALIEAMADSCGASAQQ